jgi:hypothetical protein
VRLSQDTFNNIWVLRTNYFILLKLKMIAFRDIRPCSLVEGEPGSSVSIVSGYGLDDRAIDVRFPAEAKDFFPLAFVSIPGRGPSSLLYNGYRGPLTWG